MSTLTINTQLKTHAGQPEVTFTLNGKLDNSTAPLLEEKLKPTLATKPALLIFDLASLEFVTSAGMRQFFAAAKQQKAHGGHVSFVNLQPQIKEVFDIMGSLPDMRIFQNQAELDAYLAARQNTYRP